MPSIRETLTGWGSIIPEILSLGFIVYNSLKLRFRMTISPLEVPARIYFVETEMLSMAPLLIELLKEQPMSLQV